MSDAQLDVLFGGQVDEELGDAQDLGWYGIVHWLDEPGGLIVKLDEHGIRHSWVVAGDDALTEQWERIISEYGAFYEQRDAFETATGEPDVTPSGINPKVWVGSLADYNSGELHGVWFDATCEPAELELAARFMLRLGHTPGAEEWGIFDYGHHNRRRRRPDVPLAGRRFLGLRACKDRAILRSSGLGSDFP